MKRSRIGVTWLVLALVLYPSISWANAGTPLMWASMFHLVIGNAIIGLIEGLLLSSLFKCSKGRTVLILIAANYISAWLGGFWLADHLPSFADITIENIQGWLAAYAAITFVITLLIEFPFFWWALRSTARPLRGAILATPLIHIISYGLLFFWYWAASGTSLVTRFEVVPPSALQLSKPYTLCFLTPEGDEVVSMELNDPPSRRVVSKIKAHHWNDRLFARRRDGQTFDLSAYLTSEKAADGKDFLIAESFFAQAPAEGVIIRNGSPSTTQGTWQNHGPVPSLENSSDWEFEAGFWPIGGLHGENRVTHEQVSLALELPFTAWAVRNATHLEGGCVLFQLGEDQICLVDAASRRLSLIARGRGPIVGIAHEQ